MNTALTDSLRETLALFQGADAGTPWTTSEVAEELDLGRRSTYERLQRLAERDRIETKKVGARGRVWWRPPTTDDGRTTGDDSMVSRLIDNVPGMVYRCRNEPGWPMSFVSDAASDLTGYDPDDIESGAVSWGEDVVHPDDRVRLREEVERQLADGEQFTVEYRVVTADDGTRWVREQGSAVDDGDAPAAILEGVVTDVTDEVRAKRALADRERQFRSLVQATEEYAIFRLDPDGHVQTWNAGAERIKGFDREDIVGEHFSTFYTDEDRAAGVPEANLAAATAEGVVEDEGWRVRADGSRFWANVTITAVRDEDGELRGYAKVTRDMTDRRQREQAVRHERNLLAQVLDVSPIGIGVFDDRGDPLRVNEQFPTLLGLPADDAGGYELGTQTLLDEDGEPIPYEERPAPRALATGEPVRDRRIRVDGPERRTRWLSVNAEPLDDADGVVVTMTDVSRLKEQADRLERQRDDLASEIEDVFERVDDGFFALDRDLVFTYVNDRAGDLLGLQAGDLVGERIWDVLEPGPTAVAAFEEALETQASTTFEEYYEPLDAWLEAHVYPSETGLSVYFQDVTERKERERELEQYETIVETMDDGVYVIDDEGRFVMVNDAYAAMLGYDRGELLGMTATDVVDAETAAEAQDVHRRLASGATDTARLEAELRTADGGPLVAEATFALIDGDAVGLADRVGVVRDVTERKERERELEQYETIVETVDDGIYAVDPDARFTLVNDAFCRMTGYDREELLGAHATTVHADEVTPRAETMASEVAAGERDHARIELDLLRSDGETVPAESRLAPVPYDGEASGRCGVVRDVTERLERERELRARVRQQAVVADLGQRALGDRDLDGLLAEAADLVAETLDVDYCKVLDLDADREELLLRQGVGWDDGIVGAATVSAVEDDSQAAYTLAVDEPVVVSDLATETRFGGPDLLTDHDVRSGISTVIGPGDDPWGILGTHDTAVHDFSAHDVSFVQAVANILATAVERRDHERELERQREQLAALNSLNDVVNEIIDTVLEQSTREEIEQAVCEQLAATDSYLFAWVGETDVASRTVAVRAEAGAADYLDGLTISVDPDDPRSAGATGRALLTGTVQTTRNIDTDERYAPWREHVDQYGVQSSAAIPIVHEGTVYGVLNVYADRPNAFEGEERAVVARLGEVVGHAIAATDRKRALMSDEAVELEFRVPDVFEGIDADVTGDGTVVVDHTVPLDDGEFAVYGRATADARTGVEALADHLPHWRSVTFRDDAGDTRFEARLADAPVLSVVASLGGSVEEAVVEDGDYRLTVHLSPSVDVRRVIDAVEGTYPSAEMVKRRQVARDDGDDRVRHVLREGLTERQRTVLQAAYYAGFFEWPREASGEDVAASLDISSSTFHQHLRKAEQRIFASLLTSTPPDE